MPGLIRVVDPGSIGVVAGPGRLRRVGSGGIPELEGAVRLGGNGGCVSNVRENGEDGNEAEEGEER
ncbi:hypothetical protein RchiOBHm_Chr6g0247261 [Rosa chinensis]|uniref:Uncharacterized protein n=1 Tax=Rosa chinensis TaxID=74649 RepID=A0A2P6PJR9_ROSCH|nr:hypothetical protein RchiOBHm_Chr6g0247261 [Rosa chinensis]